ncbi:MAG: hypothetical protein ABI277_06440 [Burkholderiaceae bacterium]
MAVVLCSGHATLASCADWQAQLTKARRDLGFRYVRFHGILDDAMGTLICEDDEPLYAFFNNDRIFDFLLAIGMKPVVELSFMLRTLSSGGNTVFHYRGDITPPKDFDKWGALVYCTTADAIKAVDSHLLVGGPVTSGNEWLDAFAGYGRTGDIAIDFVSTHYYPTDPFGKTETATVSQLNIEVRIAPQSVDRLKLTWGATP